MNRDEKEQLIKRYIEIYRRIIYKPFSVGISKEAKDKIEFIEANIEEIHNVVEQINENYAAFVGMGKGKNDEIILEKAIKFIQEIKPELMQLLGIEDDALYDKSISSIERVRLMHDKKFLERHSYSIYREYQEQIKKGISKSKTDLLKDAIEKIKKEEYQKVLGEDEEGSVFYNNPQFLDEYAKTIEEKYISNMYFNSREVTVTGSYDKTSLWAAIRTFRAEQYDRIYHEYVKDHDETKYNKRYKYKYFERMLPDNNGIEYLELVNARRNKESGRKEWDMPENPEDYGEILLEAMRLKFANNYEKLLKKIEEGEVEPIDVYGFDSSLYKFIYDNFQEIVDRYTQMYLDYRSENGPFSDLEGVAKIARELQREKNNDRKSVTPKNIAELSTEITTSQIGEGKTVVEQSPVVEKGDNPIGEEE